MHTKNDKTIKTKTKKGGNENKHRKKQTMTNKGKKRGKKQWTKNGANKRQQNK